MESITGGLVSVLFIYIVILFFHFLISAETSAAAPGCSGTFSSAGQVCLPGSQNAVCAVSQERVLVYMIQLGLSLSVG